MKLDLGNLNPGVFFPFDEHDKKKKDEGITIRLANSETIENINSKTTKKRAEYRRGQRFEVLVEDQTKRSELLWDYVIMDWKGVYDENDKPIPCTTENKIKLMSGSVRFAAFVGECVETLSEDTEKYEENLEKNLSK